MKYSVLILRPGAEITPGVTSTFCGFIGSLMEKVEKRLRSQFTFEEGQQLLWAVEILSPTYANVSVHLCMPPNELRIIGITLHGYTTGSHDLKILGSLEFELRGDELKLDKDASMKLEASDTPVQIARRLIMQSVRT